MISLKIKTLDSQDHDFTVDDDITVRQFKEHIATNTGISADMQRLIYCGRVLNDEKPLREYDVNGKVVHLVERAPPRTARPGDSSTTSNSTPTNSRRGDNDNNMIRRALALDGMVIGAMAVPMGGSNSGGVTTSINPSSTLCMNRIAVARHMLECADNIVTFLDNPERGLNNSEMDTFNQQILESTVFELGISAVSDADVPQQEVQNFVSAFQGAVSAAFRQNGLTATDMTASNSSSDNASSPTIMFSGANGAPVIMGTVPPPHPPSAFMGPQGQVEVASVRFSVPTRLQSATSSPTRAASSSRDAGAATVAAAATRAASAATSGAAAGATSSPAAGASSGNPNTSTPVPPPRNQTTSPQVLAEVVHQMRTVQGRLEPYVQQYYDLLQNDPAFEENDTTGRENAQRTLDRVSEALHYMSHAQHAISDLMLNLSLATPRHLCCRPILVEQSAFVSSGFPVSNLGGRRQDAAASSGNNNESATANNNTSNVAQPSTVQAADSSLSSTSSSSATSNDSSDSPPTPPTAATLGPAAAVAAVASSTAAAAQGAVNRQLHVARLIQAVVNSAPLYADVHVEINPRNGSEQSSPTAMSEASASTAQSATTDSPASNADGAAGTPLNNGADQPRVTTATHPTTSTQTRSTARPQVHLASIPTTHMRNLRPVPIPSLLLSSFDRFLPCNSHHVRENQERTARPQHIHVAHPRRGTFRRRTTLNHRVPLEVWARLQDEMQNRDDAVIHLFGCSIPIREIMTMSPSPTLLNRVRTELRAYIGNRFRLPAGTSEVTTPAGEEILQILQDSSLATAFAHPNYNALHSVNNLVRHTLPTVLSLIMSDDSDQFGVRILRALNEFIRRLFIILLIVSDGNTRPAKQFLTEMIAMAMEHNRRRQIRNFQARVLDAVSRRLETEEIVRSEVQQFLVIHIEGPAQGSTSAPVEPMETDDVTPTTSNDEQIIDDEVLPSPPNVETVLSDPSPSSVDQEPLPNVVVGSESWHSGLPATWLPVITRDIGRQRRQSPQAPYSDAYLCGMSSKRRKLITNTKPSGGNPSQILTDTMRSVLQSQSNANSITLTTEEGLAAHPHIQEPYGSFEQAIRSNIQKRIESDPDYNPERYPNCSKWMNSKK